MTMTKPCADNLRVALRDLELLTFDRTKDSFNKLRSSIITRIGQTADMLEGQFEIVVDEPKAAPARPRRTRLIKGYADPNVIPFPAGKSSAKAAADAVFRK